MIGKRVQFDDETWAAINLLRQERRRSFQQLADEAFRDLLKKHHRPADLKTQLRESAALDQHIEQLEEKVTDFKTKASGEPSSISGMAMLRKSRAKNELTRNKRPRVPK